MVATAFRKVLAVGECLLEAQAFEQCCAAMYRKNPTARLREAWLGSQQVVHELTEAYRYSAEELRQAYSSPKATPPAHFELAAP